MNRSFRRLWACTCLLFSALPAFGAAITSTWIDGNNNWNLAGHWDMGIPNNGGDTYTAVINNGSSVTLDISATINNLTIDATNALAVNNGLALTLNSGAGAGSISNNGNISLNSTGANTDLQLVGGGTVTLSGSGTLAMSNNANNRIWAPDGTTALTIGASQLVQGAGQIGLGLTTITNNGTIEANQSVGIVIVPNASGFTNNGTVQADASDTLQIQGTGALKNWNGATNTLTGGTYKAFANGLIEFDGANIVNNAANIFLSGAGSDIVNRLTSADGIAPGTFANNAAAGVFTITSARNYSVQSGFTNAGVTNVGPGSTLTLAASYINSGTLNLQGDGGTATLNVGVAATTLTGGGTIAMTNSPNNVITGIAGATLVNTNNTIQGSGNVGNGILTITNQASGIIDGNQSTPLILQPGGAVTNAGIIEANAGNLTIQGATVANAGGTIRSVGGGLLLMDPTTINGGTVTVDATSEMDLSSATITSAAVTNSGTLKSLAGTTNSIGGASSSFTNNAAANVIIQAGSALGLVNGSGATFVNNGTITLNNGAGTTLQVSGGNVNLTGTGVIQLSSDASSTIKGATGSDSLSSSNTIQGSGLLTGMGFSNSGTVNANVNGQTLTVSPSNTGWTNTGTLQASNGGTLTLSGVLTNTGGTIKANGGTVNLNGVSIMNGTLDVTSGTMQVGSCCGAALTGAVSITNGTLTVSDFSILSLQGGGTYTMGSGAGILLNSGGLATGLRIFTNGGLNTVTFAGSGTLTTSNNSLNRIYAATPANTSMTLINSAGTTITGSPQIANWGGITGGWVLNNQGTVTANQSSALLINPGGGVTNTGTLQAIAGGVLMLEGDVFTNTGGTISANGGTVKAQSITINGGTLTVANGSELQLGATTISGASVTNNSGGTISILPVQSFIGGPSSTFTNNAGASVIVQAGNLLEFDSGGTFTNNGSITLNNGAGTTLRINGGPVTLAGSGTVQMGTDGTTAILGAFGTETLNNNNTIQGSGTIQSLHLANAGTINANVSGRTLTVTPMGAWTNSGTLEATSGGTLSLGNSLDNSGTILAGASSAVLLQKGTFTNSGTINVQSTGQLDLAGNGAVTLNGGGNLIVNGWMMDSTGLNNLFTNADNTITGTGNIGNGNMTFQNNGTLNATAGGTLNVNTSAGFSNGGIVSVANGNMLAVSDAASGMSNSGSTTINAGGTLFVSGVYTQTAGSTVDDGTLIATIVNLNGGTLSGSGTVTANVTNASTLNPGDSPGTFNVSGNYTQTAGGTLNIELGSASSFDKLILTGSGTFAGALDIFSFGGFTPSDGEVFRIITFGSLASDGFASPTSFIPGFTFTQAPGATFIELTAHQTVAGVPEPSTILLLAAGLAALLFLRKRRRAQC